MKKIAVICVQPFIGRPFDDNWGLEDSTGKSDEDFVKVIKAIEKRIFEIPAWRSLTFQKQF